MRIIPAILETDPNEVSQKLEIVQADNNFKNIQIDIIDGQLLPSLTVTPHDLISLDFSDLTVDFHLMCEDPLDYVWEIAAQGNKLPTRAIYGQIERMSGQKEFLQAIKNYGWQAGLALDLDTPLESIDDDVWSQLDEILLLSVPMGQQGQEFQPQILAKIKTLEKIITSQNLKIKIIVDGGIKPLHLSLFNQTQVAGLAIGSFLWANDFSDQQQQLQVLPDC